jgi:UDP-N-acetylmuramoylalanine--D-glutamate ligase
MSEVMERRRLSARDPELAGLRVLIVGCGRSGTAAARLAIGRGARVVVTDKRGEDELGDAAAAAKSAGAELCLGGNPPAVANDAELIVVSPGVPPDIELLRRARERGVPIWGEVELAARYLRGRTIGITGSNGKSTVTTMIGEILRCAGVRVAVGGNLDRPLSELLDPVREKTYVLELSSFQLETLESLHPQVAVVLNLSPDHLDRYPDVAAYARAKARLLELQDEKAFAVLNADDEASRCFDRHVRGQLHLFSTRGEVDRGAFLRQGRLILRTGVGEEPILERAELSLPGEHNSANALAAGLAARLAGCPLESIAEGLRKYRSLPHRLEQLQTVRGVVFYNDSKATNPASTARALAAFEPGRVHLILGGKDKGGDWSELVQPIQATLRRGRSAG